MPFIPPQDLLGSLWAYVRLEEPGEEEQLQMLAGACPQQLALLPTAVALLALLQQAAGHVHPSSLPAPAQGASSASAGQGAWWHAKAAQALAAAGVRPGSLALALPRHFSVRDLFKLCDRLQRLHGGLLSSRALQLLAKQVRGNV